MYCVQKGCSFNTYVPRHGLKNFDREFYRLKIRRAPSGRPRLIQKKLRCWWTKILILLLETLLMISRSHIKVFFTIFAKLMKSTDSTFGCRTRRGHLTEAQLTRRTGIRGRKNWGNYTEIFYCIHHCSFRLSSFQILGTSFSKKKFRIWGGLKSYSSPVFLTKRPKIF